VTGRRGRGEYGRAGKLFEEAGNVFRRYLGAADRDALDCAYQAGHAYAQAGKPDKAIPQLRYYVLNAADPLVRKSDLSRARVLSRRRFVPSASGRLRVSRLGR